MKKEILNLTLKTFNRLKNNLKDTLIIMIVTPLILSFLTYNIFEVLKGYVKVELPPLDFFSTLTFYGIIVFNLTMVVIMFGDEKIFKKEKKYD